MSEIAIKVDDVSKIYKLYDKPMDRLKESLRISRNVRYKEHYALRNVSFEIKRGETVGIIGTNGAGKSTILKIITGVLNPTGGVVEIQGRISALLELGAGFNMEYTGIENIYLNGTMIGFKREEIDAKLESILKFADIGDFVYQPVKTYSSGMFVRLAFAVAINIEPEILIVDEALSVGDVFFQAKCYKKFEEFKEQGKTILFVSHDLSSISKYCDTVVLLNQGGKIDEGTPKDMVNLYKKLLVNQLDISSDSEQAEEETSSIEIKSRKEKMSGSQGNERHLLTLNPNCNEYGTKEIEIIDFAIYDNQDIVSSTIEKGTKFQIMMRVKFHKKVQGPIVAFTITNLKGDEVSGTNTMIEKEYFFAEKEEDEFVVTFSQRMDFQGGEYLLSLGCTGFEQDDFQVYHRLYDVCNISVISDKNTVGFFDMNSKVDVEALQ
ncbi:MAG: ABC transporter ATP-binding protein [Lachnospiraceae bacterium]|nr:ABC transporter ATP-binding protein [Lachnospiraceae bacterium]